MASAGAFDSEIFFHGQRYRFAAQFSSVLWSAQVFTDRGVSCGSIACTAHPSSLDLDGLEDSVADWVHQALVSGIGLFALPEENEVSRSVHEAHSHPADVAANGAFYRPLQAVSHESPANAVLRRARELNQNSREAMQRFGEVAAAYTDLCRHISASRNIGAVQ